MSAEMAHWANFKKTPETLFVFNKLVVTYPE